MAVEECSFTDGTVDVVVLPEVGARIHRVRAFGHDLLRTPQDSAEHLRDPFYWGAYVMAPWCNRIETGVLDIGSRRIALHSNFPDGSAIHGQVYARPWERVGDGALRVTGGGDGWPWTYDVGLRISVADRSVRIRLSLTNTSSDPMPAGLGLHPWFRRPLLVAIRGAAVFTRNAATEARPVPAHGPFDLRAVDEMPADLDATWTDLAEPPVELRWPDQGVGATMRIASPTRHVVAASPGGLDAIAVEPETHAPQGLRRLLNGEPGGLTMLGPGRTLDLGVELAFERLGDARM